MSKLIAVEPLGFPWKTQDPFLFCAYHKDEYPNGTSNMGVALELLKGRPIGQDFSPQHNWRMYHGTHIPGFPYHPHRGFETITINKQGVVDHSDSLGAAGRFMEGDVQWMTAGKGILHSEMFPLLNEQEGNTLEIFQVWLNLPKQSKMVEPHFKMLWKEDIPIIHHKDSEDKTTTIQLIAGSMNQQHALPPTPDSWASNTENAVGVYVIEMNPSAIWQLPKAKEGVNRTLFYYSGGTALIEDQEISANHLIEAVAHQDISIKNGASTSHFLILEGRPIQEPVVQYGPFVMNTEAEIHEAIADYNRTQFGGWPWAEQEVTHAKDKGRFALHSDGKEEIK